MDVSDTCRVVLSDTVGFIAKLPHHLIEAFQATLEELEYADVLLHVIDASDPERADHIEVVNRLIEKLAKPGTPVIECYNKCDLVLPEEMPRGLDFVCVSARSGEGMDALLRKIEQTLDAGKHQAVFLLPYNMAGYVDTLHAQAKVLRCEYEAEGIRIEAIVDETLFGRLRPYMQEA